MIYRRSHTQHAILTWLSLGFLCASSAYSDENVSAVYGRLKNHIDGIKVINTHEHQDYWGEYSPDNCTFYTHLASAYLCTDLVSAGAPAFEPNIVNQGDLDVLWDMYGESLNLSRNTSYYGSFIRGFQSLYDFDDPYFTKQNIASLTRAIRKNYRNLEDWYAEAFERAGFELMLVNTLDDPFQPKLDPKYYAEVFPVDYIIWCAGERWRLTVKENPVFDDWFENRFYRYSIYKRAEDDGQAIEDFDDYIEYSSTQLNRAVSRNCVALKNVLAYVRSIDFAEVSYERARTLFRKSATTRLSAEETKAIQDFMVHWSIEKAVEYDLPTQIHTGYLYGNGRTLLNSHPIHLNKIFLKYPQAKFVLFHGGYPWTSEFCALGKMFPNVYLDLVWLPQISRSEAIRTLHEMLDTVPYNKFFWGGDCTLIEESVGSLEYGKEVVTEVLASRVDKGLMTEALARDVANKIFRENAIAFFKLEERLKERRTNPATKSARAPQTQKQPPIIDMHAHVSWGSGKKDQWYGMEAPSDYKLALRENYQRFRKHNIVKVVVSGPLDAVEFWKSKDEDNRIIRGIFACDPNDLEMDTEEFETSIKSGKIEVFGELVPMNGGLTLNDPAWQPYLKICEQYDVPVSVHTGRVGPETYKWRPKSRLRLGDPYLIEDVLLRYPKLRVYTSHVGMEWHEHTLALMRVHPELYTDLGGNLWVPTIQRYAREFLANAKEAGCLNRVLFGSDQMEWPQAIDMSIDYLNSLEFLTEQEKRDIFYNNAARFLKLEQ